MFAYVILGLVSSGGFLKFRAEDDFGSLLKSGVKKNWEGKKGRKLKKVKDEDLKRGVYE
jgi:hypothetical protein